MESRQILLDLISVVKYLNQEIKIAHTDIKPDNVLIVKTKNLVFPILINLTFPLPIEKNINIDRKLLSLIYLEMIGFTPSQINQFKKNLNRYLVIDGTVTKSEIQNFIPYDTIIAAEMIGFTPSQINQFKYNQNWYLTIDQTMTKSEIQKLIPSDVIITSSQIQALAAFYDGTDFDSLYQIVKETNFYPVIGETPIT